MVFVSFIVPIYNTSYEKVVRCINSILKVTEAEFECVVVDDGSTNENAAAYRSLCETDSCLHYYRKENGGVGSARNYGIEKATGEYVYFVDSDDELIPQAMDDVLLYIKAQNRYDIVFANIELQENGNISPFLPFTGSFEISCKEVLSSMTKDGTMNGPVAKLIRREFLNKNGIRFDETMINGEDAVFQLDMMKFAPYMYFTDVYTYRYHRFSETGLGRTLRFPETVLNNQIILHDKYCALIQSDHVAKTGQESLKRQQEELFVRNLLRWILDLVDAGLLDYSLEKKMQDALIHFELKHRCRLSFGGRISLRIMKMNSKLLFDCLALLRRYYLKLKAIQ